MYSFVIADSDGRQVLDLGNRLIPESVKINKDGVQATAMLSFAESSIIASNPKVRKLIVTRFGKIQVYRLHQPKVDGVMVQINAVSLQSALNDVEYNAFWSSTDLSDWFLVSEDMRAGNNNKLYATDKDNRLFIGLKKNTIYPISGSLIQQAAYAWQTPLLSSRKVSYIQCSFETNLATAFIFELFSIADTIATGAPSMLYSYQCTGGAVKLALSLPYAANHILYARIRNNSDTNYTNTAEDGVNYFKMTSIRVASSNANAINSTIAAAISTGTQTITPASMANIAIGRQLVINSGATDSELIVVTATTATTFTATFAKAHAANSSVRGCFVTDREIIQDVIATQRAANPNWLNASSAWIQASADDQENRTYDRVKGIDVLADLAKRLDVVYGVKPSGEVYFYPSSQYRRVFAIDAESGSFHRPLANLINRTTATYDDQNNVAQVTATANNLGSQVINGIVRSQTIDAPTTSAAKAATIRDLSLAQTSQRPLQIDYAVQAVYSEQGALYPIDSPQPNDQITIRNISTLWSPDVTQRIAIDDVQVTPALNRVELTPADPPDRLDRYLARIK